MFELKEYCKGYFTTFYFRNSKTGEVWMPVNELKRNFQMDEELIAIIIRITGNMSIITRNDSYYGICTRFDAFYERGEASPIICVCMEEIANNLNLFLVCTKINDFHAIYFKETTKFKQSVVNSSLASTIPTTIPLAIRCPYELMQRLEERIKKDDISTKTEAVTQALTFWLDNNPLIKKEDPMTRSDEDKLRAMKEILDTFFLEKEPQNVPAPDEPKDENPPTEEISLPLFRPGYHLSIGQMAGLYYKSFQLGRNQMFSILRAMGVIQVEGTLPRQVFIQSGMFEVVASVKDGKTFTQAVLTPKGQVWLPKQIKNYFNSLLES